MKRKMTFSIDSLLTPQATTTSTRMELITTSQSNNTNNNNNPSSSGLSLSGSFSSSSSSSGNSPTNNNSAVVLPALLKYSQQLSETMMKQAPSNNPSLLNNNNNSVNLMTATSGTGSSGGRSPRVPFSRYQITVLENKFQTTHYLSSNEVTELANQLSLTETRVKIWFQNRRARERRESGNSSSSGNMTPACFNELAQGLVAKSPGIGGAGSGILNEITELHQRIMMDLIKQRTD